MATRSREIDVPASTSADELESMLEQLPVGALLAESPTGRITFANLRARELWSDDRPLAATIDGYANVFIGFRSNGRQYASDEWPLARAVQDGEHVADEEIEIRLGSGERRIMLVSATPLCNETGDIRRAVSLFHDITDMRHEARRREFLMELTDELRMLDDDVAIMEVAAAATGEQLGVSSTSYADVDEHTQYAVVHAEYRNGRIVHDSKYYLEDFGTQLAERIRAGSTVVIEDIASDPRALKDVFDGWGLRSLIAAPVVRQGRLVALFAVLHNAPRRWTRSDITLVEQVGERAWHAVDSARAQADLRQSREWLGLALRAGSAAIWEWDLRTGRIHWSEEHRALLGLQSARRTLTFGRWLALVHEDDRPAAREASRRIATMRDGEIEFEYRLAGTAEPRWLTMRGSVIADASGSPQRVVGVAVDTTERKSTELEREALLHQAREASEAKSHFISVISHEFRTPLTAIIGYADLLSTGVSGELKPIQVRQLDRVRASAWHLTQMVDEILTFSRIEAGRESVSIDVTDALALARETAALIGPSAALKGLALTCELPDGQITLRTDSGKLRQILLNLLGNAVKFTETGGITLSVRRVGNGLEFAVADTGIGIAEEHVERIFERFWQVSQGTARTVSGAGLGLTVSRQLAELLDGQLTVESALGSGTTFRLRLSS